MTKKRSSTDAWKTGLKAISDRLQDEDLISAEQAQTMSSLADELGESDPATALSLMATAYSAVGFERLSRQQAQASGTLALVRSATALSDEQRSLLKKQLRERFGQEFVLRMEVDPSLLGGIVVRVRDQVLDGSVAGRLHTLGERLRSAASEVRSPAAELVETDD
jgi:F-type H+-transporting ATPase subunit delta